MQCQNKGCGNSVHPGYQFCGKGCGIGGHRHVGFKDPSDIGYAPQSAGAAPRTTTPPPAAASLVHALSSLALSTGGATTTAVWCQNKTCVSMAISGSMYCRKGCTPSGADHKGNKVTGDQGYAIPTAVDRSSGVRRYRCFIALFSSLIII